MIAQAWGLLELQRGNVLAAVLLLERCVQVKFMHCLRIATRVLFHARTPGNPVDLQMKKGSSDTEWKQERDSNRSTDRLPHMSMSVKLLILCE